MSDNACIIHKDDNGNKESPHLRWVPPSYNGDIISGVAYDNNKVNFLKSALFEMGD